MNPILNGVLCFSLPLTAIQLVFIANHLAAIVRLLEAMNP